MDPARPWHVFYVSLGILHDMEATVGSTVLRAKPCVAQNPKETPVLEISPKMLKYNEVAPRVACPEMCYHTSTISLIEGLLGVVYSRA